MQYANDMTKEEWIELLDNKLEKLEQDLDDLYTANADLTTERDEARKWARNLLARWNNQHWVTMRLDKYNKDDEATFAALTAERDALQERNADLSARLTMGGNLGDHVIATMVTMDGTILAGKTCMLCGCLIDDEQYQRRGIVCLKCEKRTIPSNWCILSKKTGNNGRCDDD